MTAAIFLPPLAWGLDCAARGKLCSAKRLLFSAAGVAPTADRTLARPQALLIEQLIAGLPGAAIVLDREGRVIAFNEAASGIAPALRRGEPALIALRMPELVDAIRRAAKRREPQRVEFFERVPLDRWFEAFVTADQTRDRQRRCR